MRALIFALITTTTAFGCSKSDKTAKTDQTDPSVAKTEEVVKQDIAKATDKVTDVAVRTGHEADDKATAAVEAVNGAKVDIKATTATAEADLKLAHDAARDKLQQAFDATDRRYVALQADVAKASGATKARADAAAAEVKTREAAVMAGIAKLRTTTGADWDATKTQLDADAASLAKSIDNLAAALK